MKLPWIKDNKTKIKKLYKYNVFKSKKTNKIYNKNLKISQYSINWSKSQKKKKFRSKNKTKKAKNN